MSKMTLTETIEILLSALASEGDFLQVYTEDEKDFGTENLETLVEVGFLYVGDDEMRKGGVSYEATAKGIAKCIAGLITK